MLDGEAAGYAALLLRTTQGKISAQFERLFGELNHKKE